MAGSWPNPDYGRVVAEDLGRDQRGRLFGGTLEHRADQSGNVHGVVKGLPDLVIGERASVKGYAVDDEENEPNVRCVGSAVYGPDGCVLGGISVSGLTFAFTMSELEVVGPLVIAAAASLSAALGQPRFAS